MRITAKMLRDKKACASQYELFVATYPDGFDVTAENLSEARKAGLDVGWATCLLPPDIRLVSDAAMAEPRKVYDAAMAEAHKVYDAAVDRALVAAFAMMDEVKK